MVKVKYSQGIGTDKNIKAPRNIDGKEVARENEDIFLIKRERLDIRLLMIADGVGSLNTGKEASEYIKESIETWFTLNADDLSAKDSDGIKSEMHDIILQIHEALREKSQNIFGSTLTLAILKKNKYIVAQVGDSRAYLYDGQVLKQITKDQTLYQRALDKGEDIAEDDVDRLQRTLIQCIGWDKIVPQYYEDLLPTEYTMLLCSDGLYGKLSARDFEKELSKDIMGNEKIKNLIALARSRGEKDDITAVMLRREIYKG